jgi:hypothetical protein
VQRPRGVLLNRADRVDPAPADIAGAEAQAFRARLRDGQPKCAQRQYRYAPGDMVNDIRVKELRLSRYRFECWRKLQTPFHQT